MDGDSITAGTEVTTPWPSLITNLTYAKHNVAVPGETIATMLANAPANVDVFYTATKKNMVFIWGGTNDIEFGATALATYNNLVAYAQGRRALGFKVITATMLSRIGFDTQKNSYNALILADSTNFDLKVDFTGTPLGCDGCYANTTWFNVDGVHPNNAGETTYIVPAMQTAFNTLK